MSGPLPTLSAVQLVAALRRRGFAPNRQSGSHLVLRHPGGRWTTVPIHKARDVSKGTLRGILKDAGLTIDELLAR